MPSCGACARICVDRRLQAPQPKAGIYVGDRLQLPSPAFIRTQQPSFPCARKKISNSGVLCTAPLFSGITASNLFRVFGSVPSSHLSEHCAKTDTVCVASLRGHGPMELIICQRIYTAVRCTRASLPVTSVHRFNPSVYPILYRISAILI